MPCVTNLGVRLKPITINCLQELFKNFIEFSSSFAFFFWLCVCGGGGRGGGVVRNILGI